MDNTQPKTFIIGIDERWYPSVLYKCDGNIVRKDKVIYAGKYDGYYLVHVTEYDERDAKKKAIDIVKAEDDRKSHGLKFRFPKLVNGSSERMIWGAEVSREVFVTDHFERFQELTEVITSKDKYNWELLHKMKVTSQEWVVLFSNDAGDMYARGICTKHYTGKWALEVYGEPTKVKVEE